MHFQSFWAKIDFDYLFKAEMVRVWDIFWWFHEIYLNSTKMEQENKGSGRSCKTAFLDFDGISSILEWILIVVRDFHTFSHPFADLALRNAFLGVLETIFALLPPKSISLTFLKQKKVTFWEENQATSKNHCFFFNLSRPGALQLQVDFLWKSSRNIAQTNAFTWLSLKWNLAPQAGISHYRVLL